MKRKVFLEGELGSRFIRELEIVAETPADVFRCLDANFPEFQKYTIEQHQNDVGFIVDVAGEPLEYESELLMNISQGDITVTPAPAGSSSGGGKILAAIAIAIAVATAQTYLLPGLVKAGTISAATASTITAVGYSMAINLALTGIMQLMAPDPATDNDQEQSYLFNGAEQNIIEGDPVPVLYGKLRVPGQPISFDLSAASSINGGSTIILTDGEVLDLDLNWSGENNFLVTTPNNLNVNP